MTPLTERSMISVETPNANKKSYTTSALIILLLFILIITSNIPTKKFVANLKSGIYHRLDCEFGQKINPENRLYYFRKEDIQKGFRSCHVCAPDEKK
jgi:hypothetical protein